MGQRFNESDHELVETFGEVKVWVNKRDRQFITVTTGETPEEEGVYTLQEFGHLRRIMRGMNVQRALRPNKDWSQCAYEGHHDTCTCNGAGGDR